MATICSSAPRFSFGSEVVFNGSLVYGKRVAAAHGVREYGMIWEMRTGGRRTATMSGADRKAQAALPHYAEDQKPFGFSAAVSRRASLIGRERALRFH